MSDKKQVVEGFVLESFKPLFWDKNREVEALSFSYPIRKERERHHHVKVRVTVEVLEDDCEKLADKT